ncbi:MAG: efflux RND transporter periplasmic adaptor subunit, partial [Acidobacteriota bacterium]
MSITSRTITACLLAAASLAGCAHEAKAPAPLTPVRVAPVTASGAPGTPRYSAAILPASRVDLAFKVPGYVAEIEQVAGGTGGRRPLQEGDRVTRGQVLTRLRSNDYDTKVDQAKSQESEVEAALGQAKQAFDRAQGLYDRKSLTRPDYDAAKAAYETVLAKQAGARALSAEAQNARADSSLRSPMNGVILKRLIEVGSLVGPGTPGFVIADTSSVKVLFGAPDTVVRGLSLQRAVTITTPAYPNQPFAGRITSLAPAASPGSLVFDVEVTVPNHDGRLKPGMVASFELAAETAPVQATVSLAAILRSRTRPDGYALFVVDEQNGAHHARLREVTLGDMVANGVSVTSGVRPGDQVVVSGATIVALQEATQVKGES